jgi:tetratricopeptide (TPR) repeat protein
MAKVSLRAYNQEIETMIDRGHLDEAIAHCRHILKTFPKHLDTYRLLGKAYLEYKRYPEAADIFSRVLVAAPSDFVSNVGMSIIRDEETRLDEAIWHMERAFETQPSNAAIQSEMQRLYGRREGVQPPRIRMTRGALAHMYVQGELYPQAISEIKSVLKEDPGRNDMQALLARAYYRNGLKNDAAEVASAVLRSNPYNLDANRIMVEILGTDHPESVGAYRQRVVELDPYAAQVSGSTFMANEVPDAAVSLEHLDWNGQPVGLQPDWQSRQAITLDREPAQEEQPDWLKSTFGETSASGQPAPVSPLDAAAPLAGAAEAADEIPDFLRDAGWGKSTGAFDESKSAFAESEPTGAEPTIERGELPDWVKAMAPQQTPETPAEEEELPDWINKIGTSALPAASDTANQDDWIKGLEETPAQPTEGQPDWLKGFSETEQPAISASSEEPDWLKGFANEQEAAPAETPAGDLDWLTQLSAREAAQAASPQASADELEFISRPSEPFDAAPSVPASEGLDWLDEPGTQPETALPGASGDDFDFLDPLGSQLERRQAALPSEDLDFLNELTPEPFSPATPSEPAKAGTLGMSEDEQDDAFAWLESLAAKQGATEGLLTTPEERLDEEPEWVRQAKGMDTTPVEPPVETPAVAQPAASIEELGKTEQEQEDSFAWLESLAAKQGATEGLLTEPEERREEAPEWVQRAASLGESSHEEPTLEELPRSEQPSFAEPVTDLEALGTTEQEREDSFSWLEALAAKQGATEGLLTRPEERPEEEPDWVKQAKDVSEPSALTPVTEPGSATDEVELWLQSLEGETSAVAEPQETRAEEPSLETPFVEPAAALDDTSAWLRTLEQEETEPRAEEPALASPLAESPVSSGEAEPAAWLQELESADEVSSKDDTAAWLKSLDQLEKITPEPERDMQPEELPDWIQDIEKDQQVAEGLAAEPAPADEVPPVTEWMADVEETPEPVAQDTPKVETGGLPSWLRGLEEEEAQTARFGAEADLPAWLRDEAGDTIAEAPQIEPTRAADWQPVEMEAVEPEPGPAEPMIPESVAPQPAEMAAPEPETIAPPAPRPEPVDVVAIIEEKVAAVGREEPAPARAVRVPAPRKATGMLDPVLAQARSEFSRSNLSGALENYSRLIKKGRLLEDIIYDLREASYRYPVDVDIWQSLGDAYMRSNRLQDALDAYTKAEELIR